MAEPELFPRDCHMRPLSFYAVYADGQVTDIVEGAATARKIYNNRAYRRCATRLDAEEYAAWFNYEAELRRRANAPRTPAVGSLRELSPTARAQGRAAKAFEELFLERLAQRLTYAQAISRALRPTE